MESCVSTRRVVLYLVVFIMALHDGHNYYFDLFEEEAVASAVFTEDEPEAGAWVRAGREYYTVGEIETVSVAKVEANEVGDLLYGNERG